MRVHFGLPNLFDLGLRMLDEIYLGKYYIATNNLGYFLIRLLLSVDFDDYARLKQNPDHKRIVEHMLDLDLFEVVLSLFNGTTLHE